MSTLMTAQVAYEFEDFDDIFLECAERIEPDEVWGSDPETCRSPI